MMNGRIDENINQVMKALYALFIPAPELVDFFIYEDLLLGPHVSNLAFCAPEAIGMERRLLLQAGMDMAYGGGGLFLPAALSHWSNEHWRAFINAIETLRNLKQSEPGRISPTLMQTLNELF